MWLPIAVLRTAYPQLRLLESRVAVSVHTMHILRLRQAVTPVQHTRGCRSHALSSQMTRSQTAARIAGLEADNGPGAAAVDHVRVIVGRGRHSAGGEASLPRAIEGYLMDQGRKYTAKRGAIEVHLRRGRRPASAPATR